MQAIRAGTCRMSFTLWSIALCLSFAQSVEADPIQWSQNGHYYETVLVPGGVTWEEAASLAASRTWMGSRGHLVTLTSAEEDSWVWSALGAPINLCLGGYQPPGSPEPDGGWRWVTGEAWDFTRWAPGEPNNAGDGEDALVYKTTPPDTWNDYPRDAIYPGYIVEYEPDPSLPPFEILSAQFDQDVYHNGEDTAHLVITIKNNWGSEPLLVEPILVSQFADSFSMGIELFDGEPEETRQLDFYWFVPEHVAWDFSLTVEVSRDGAVVLRKEFEGFIGAELSDEEQQEIISYVESCTDPGDHCLPAIIGIVPILGLPFSIQGYKDAACIFHEQVQSGWVPGMVAAGLITVVSAIDVAIGFWDVAGCFLGGPVAWVPGLFTGIPLAVGWCLYDLLGEYGRGDPESVVLALAEGSYVVGLEHSRRFADRIFLAGARSRVLADGGYADADSTELFDCLYWCFDSLGVEVAYVGPNPHFFGEGHDNSHAELTLEFTTLRPDTMKLVILHETDSDSTMWLEWPPLPLDTTSVARLFLADYVSDYPRAFGISVDYDGDGVVDFDWYPGPTTGVDGRTATTARPAVYDLRAYPNPGVGSVELSFWASQALQDVWVVVYDVSGREVERLSMGDIGPGPHELSWEVTTSSGRLPAGVYYYRVLHSGGQSAGRKWVLLR
jgi:hypothetical protein